MTSAQLDDKVAIITGGAMGLGRGTVERFVAEGAKVIVADMNEGVGTTLVAELGPAAIFVRHDVTDESSWSALVKAATDAFGGIDILINNAGIMHVTPLVEETVADFDQVIAVNLRGVWLGMQAVAEPMRQRGGGAIVNLSSTAGLTGFEGMVAYGASKWGVRGITKIAAVELGPWGIRVNSIHPGGIDTALTEPWKPSGGRPLDMPLRRLGTPEDIASLHLFLVSDESSWISGAEIGIDGGKLAGFARIPD